MPRLRHRRVQDRDAGQGRDLHQAFVAEKVREMTGSGRFSATADFAELANVDAILICVPTPLTATREPDLRSHLNHGGHRRLSAAGAARGAGIHHLSRHDRGSGAADPGDQRAQGRPRFPSRLLARARGSGQPIETRKIPKIVGGMRRTLGRTAPPSSTASPSSECTGVRRADRRGREDHREHLPLREHRAGERTQARLFARWASTSGM